MASVMPYGSKNRNQAGQVILKVVALVLEELVQSNDTEPNEPRPLTKFHGLQAPGISVTMYLERIGKFSGCSNECFVLSLVYIDRLITRKQVILDSKNVHRLVITAVMLAAKFFDDHYLDNAHYGAVGGVPAPEMNGLELEFLFLIEFNLHVSSADYEMYRKALANKAQIQNVGHVPIAKPHAQLGLGLGSGLGQQPQHATGGVIQNTMQQQQHNDLTPPVGGLINPGGAIEQQLQQQQPGFFAPPGAIGDTDNNNLNSGLSARASTFTHKPMPPSVDAGIGGVIRQNNEPLYDAVAAQQQQHAQVFYQQQQQQQQQHYGYQAPGIPPVQHQHQPYQQEHVMFSAGSQHFREQQQAGFVSRVDERQQHHLQQQQQRMHNQQVHGGNQAPDPSGQPGGAPLAWA